MLRTWPASSRKMLKDRLPASERSKLSGLADGTGPTAAMRGFNPHHPPEGTAKACLEKLEAPDEDKGEFYLSGIKPFTPCDQPEWPMTSGRVASWQPVVVVKPQQAKPRGSLFFSRRRPGARYLGLYHAEQSSVYVSEHHYQGDQQRQWRSMPWHPGCEMSQDGSVDGGMGGGEHEAANSRGMKPLGAEDEYSSDEDDDGFDMGQQMHSKRGTMIGGKPLTGAQSGDVRRGTALNGPRGFGAQNPNDLSGPNLRRGTNLTGLGGNMRDSSMRSTMKRTTTTRARSTMRDSGTSSIGTSSAGGLVNIDDNSDFSSSEESEENEAGKDAEDTPEQHF